MYIQKYDYLPKHGCYLKLKKKMYQLDGFLFQIVVLQQITKINKN